MRFRTLRNIIIALIIIVIGAIFFLEYAIRSRDARSGGRHAAPAVKGDSRPLRERVRSLLAELERSGRLKVRENGRGIEIVVHGPAAAQIAESVRAGYPDVSVEEGAGQLVFSSGAERMTVFVVPGRPDGSLPRLVIVIDDVGNSKEAVDELMRLKGVTVSVIPGLAHSRYAAEQARKRHMDVLVHVPMEPKNRDKYNHADVMLTTAMDAARIKQLTAELLDAVPGAVGANNHMGSKFTEDGPRMRAFLETVKKKKLFFLDSRTSSDSRGYEEAGAAGVKRFRRDIFLDHEIDEAKITEQLDRAVAEAGKNGLAIAIGHPHPETLLVLKKRLPGLAQHIEITSLSQAN